MPKKLTLVTGYYDDETNDETNDKTNVLEKIQTLGQKCNLIIYSDKISEAGLDPETNKIKSIQVINRSIQWFKSNEYYDKLGQDIKRSLDMSKMFLLNDARMLDGSNSDYLYWINIDLIIDHWINENFDKLFERIDDIMMCVTELGQTIKIDGCFFGGNKKQIESMNACYYGIMMDLLEKYNQSTENDVLTRLINDSNNSNDLNYFNVGNKQIGSIQIDKNKKIEDVKTHLYVLTYNFPLQFEKLIESFKIADNDFLTKPKKFLLNNSTDCLTNCAYDQLCDINGFEQIKMNNIGICGGRQYIAEHFDQSDADYYIFFEDDMMLHCDTTQREPEGGFQEWVPGLYMKTLQIIHKENYDFLKLSFKEVYGNNSVQWAWYNVPDDVRIRYFPEKTKKPIRGLDPNAPLTRFTHIKQHENLNYIEGEVYYCNWPLWMSRSGNKKVFLEPKFEHPYEQTWMSLVFQKHKQNLLKASCLLLSPINHNRLHYYKADERKEN